MVIINSTDLRTNQRKYLDLAQTEQVFIKRGRQLIELVVRPCDITEEDLANGISGRQLIKEVTANIMKFPDK